METYNPIYTADVVDSAFSDITEVALENKAKGELEESGFSQEESRALLDLSDLIKRPLWYIMLQSRYSDIQDYWSSHSIYDNISMPTEVDWLEYVDRSKTSTTTLLRIALFKTVAGLVSSTGCEEIIKDKMLSLVEQHKSLEVCRGEKQ